MSAIAAGAILDGPGDGAAGPDVWDSRDAGNDTGVISSAEEVDEYYATLAETWLGVPAGGLLPGSPNPSSRKPHPHWRLGVRRAQNQRAAPSALT
jgi:hypothetical protein